MGVRWVSNGCQMGVLWVSDRCQTSMHIEMCPVRKEIVRAQHEKRIKHCLAQQLVLLPLKISNNLLLELH